MTKRVDDPWLSGDPEVDELLARVMSSSAEDQPVPARVDALVDRVAQMNVAAPVPGAVAVKAAGAAVKSALAVKLGAMVSVCALTGAAILHRQETTHVPLPAATKIVAPAPVAPPPSIVESAPEERTEVVEVVEPRPRARRRRAEPTSIAEPPQLERELRILSAMREALASDPCTTLRLGEGHRAEFEAPVLAPERDQLLEAARAKLTDGACPR